MANVIQALNKPTLIIAHNKTLAAQLYSEFKEFFPENAVEYFVSYYDYYQPEAYVPSTDTYIEKDSAINDEIDKLRHSATAALSERNDVIIVASVSCIYGLGSPIDYKNMVISLRPGMEKDRDEVIHKLIDIQYTRNEMDFKRGSFRVRGDVLEVFPAYSGSEAYRIEFFGDEVDRIVQIDALTGEVKAQLGHVAIFPASHYVVPKEKMMIAADKVVMVDDTLIPTDVVPVAGTDFDFTSFHEVGERRGGRYDHCFVFNAAQKSEVVCDGLSLTVDTDRPAMQLYTGEFNPSCNCLWPSSGPFCALALETSEYPDAVNRKDFPSAVLDAGQVFKTRTSYTVREVE